MRTIRLWRHKDHKTSICSMRRHQNFRFFLKNGHKWPFFGLKLSFSASDKQLKTQPPYYEGAGCRKKGCRGTQTTNARFTASVGSKICHFSGNTGQKWLFCAQKLSVVASDKQLNPPPPYSEGAGYKKAVVEP